MSRFDEKHEDAGSIRGLYTRLGLGGCLRVCVHATRGPRGARGAKSRETHWFGLDHLDRVQEPRTGSWLTYAFSFASVDKR